MSEHQLVTCQIVFDDETSTIQVRIPLREGNGDHVLAVLPATLPPAAE